jgi:hypothetical protein
MKLHKSATFLMIALVVCFAFAVPAMAQKIIGGHDESMEDHTLTPPWALTSAATPGVSPAVAGSHLLITEVGVRGLNSATLADSTEFIEIYNPTSEQIDLTKYYLSDVNAYSSLPVGGNVNVAQEATDFAMRFPQGAIILPGGVKVVAIQGSWYKELTGMDADFMMFYRSRAGAPPHLAPTTAVSMIDVATNKPVTYPTFGELTNGGEFVWLFYWDGVSDLVCDVDLVYWGSGTGANLVSRKTAALCQDGPDVGAVPSCYNLDAGNPAGAMTKALVLPASGAGTRQRVTTEGAEALVGGNGCMPGGPTPVENSTWGNIKTLYR